MYHLLPQTWKVDLCISTGSVINLYFCCQNFSDGSEGSVYKAGVSSGPWHVSCWSIKANISWIVSLYQPSENLTDQPRLAQMPLKPVHQSKEEHSGKAGRQYNPYRHLRFTSVVSTYISVQGGQVKLISPASKMTFTNLSFNGPHCLQRHFHRLAVDLK